MGEAGKGAACAVLLLAGLNVDPSGGVDMGITARPQTDVNNKYHDRSVIDPSCHVLGRVLLGGWKYAGKGPAPLF